MSDHDEHLDELMRACANATPFARLNATEQAAVFNWLLDGGHMTRTGKPLERPRPAPIVKAYDLDGQPIYDPKADHRTHETVTMR
jgi:hypothetical protein